MSPPIFNPDGPEVSEIVLPNGATASEVIDPDGNVVFEAGPDIPDSGLVHHYDWSIASGTSTVEDQAGSADLTGSYSGVTGSINGNDAGRFDGSDDQLTASIATISQPFEIFGVAQFKSDTGNTQIWHDGGANVVEFYWNGGDDNFALYFGNVVKDGAGDTNAHIWDVIADGAGSDLRLDGTLQINSSNAGTNDLDGITIGSAYYDDYYAELDVGELMYYNEEKSAPERSEIESYLSDKWGIAI